MKKNKYIKFLGNILMLLSIIFLIIRLRKLDIDYSVLLQSSNIVIICGLSVLYGIHIFLLGLSWRCLIKMISGKKVRADKAIFVWNKSNMMKYIPGNIFQYIGRNEIAITDKLNHADVAMATVSDVIINLIGVFCVVLVSYSHGLKIGIKLVLENQMYLIAVTAVVIILIVVILVFRKKIFPYLNKFKALLNKRNIIKVIFLILFYAFWAVYTSGIYLVILKQIVGAEILQSDFGMIMGSYLLSWMIGFIMPGAPGGIGVREAALTILLSPFERIQIDKILLAIVIYRFVNIIGDILGLLTSFFVIKIRGDNEMKKE